MAARTSFILQTTVLLFLTAACSGFLYADKAVINPVDALVFIGETLRVMCTLKSNAINITSTDMYISIYYTSSSAPWIVPRENTTIIDNKTIHALIEITDSYSSYTTIKCITNNTQLISKGLFVERAIQNITNFSGLYYWDENRIDTKWSLGETYLGTVNVDIDWNQNSPPNLSGNRCNSSAKESCVIGFTGNGILFFRINVWVNPNKRPSKEYLVPLYDTQATSVHMFEPQNNLKTGPPQSVTVIDKSSMCVNISWKNPQYYSSSTVDAIFRFEMKAEDEAEYRVAADNVTTPNSTEFMQLCQLIPYTKYSLSVRIKDRMVNPWSEQASVEVLTEEGRPLTGPPLNDTSYYAGKCLENKRNVFVYWNDPPKSSLQGQLTMYEIVRDNNTQILRAASNYYNADFDCVSTYEILIYSATKVGPSLRPSSITIPKETEELTVADDLMFRVEITSEASVRSSMNISDTWDPGDLAGDTSLILYVCQETYIPNTCLNDFTTIEVNVSQRNLVVNNIPVTTNLFGYSLRDKNGLKRGIKWTSCIFRADLRPVQPTELNVKPGSIANSLLISWTSMQCSKTTKVLILKYHLYICQQAVIVSLINVSCSHYIRSNLSINNYFAKDLKGGHRYYVYIQAESPAGIGPLSDPEDGIPNTLKSPDTELEIILGASLGISTGIIALATLIFFLARQWRKAKIRAEAYSKGLEWPKTSEFMNKTYDQDTTESGIYTDSAQNSNTERISEILDKSSLPKQVSQQFLSPLTEKCHFSAEDTISIAENQQFLEQRPREDSHSRDHKGEDSNPSADLKSQQFVDYIRCGAIDISSQEVLLQSMCAVDREIDDPYINSQEVLLPASTNASHQSMDATVSSFGQVAHFQQDCHPYILYRLDDASQSQLIVSKAAGSITKQPTNQLLVVIEGSDNPLQTECAVTTSQIDLEISDPAENRSDYSESQASGPGYVAHNLLQHSTDASWGSETPTSLHDSSNVSELTDLSVDSSDYKTINYVCI